jgi:hypothetical protein
VRAEYPEFRRLALRRWTMTGRLQLSFASSAVSTKPRRQPLQGETKE